MNNIAIDIETLDRLITQSVKSVLRESIRESWKDRFSLEEQKRLHRIARKMKSGKGLDDDEIQLATHAGLFPREQAFAWTQDFQDSSSRAEKHLKEGKVKNANSVNDLIKQLDIRE